MTLHYPPFFEGGYELNCKVVAEELIKRGHKVFILTNKKEIIEKEENIFRILYEYNPLDNGSLKKRYYQLIWTYLSRKNYFITLNLAKQLKPDVAYIWQLSNMTMLPLIALQKLNIPVVFHLGDYWLSCSKKYFVFEKNPLKRIYRKIITGVNNFNFLDLRHLLVISNALKKEYIRLGFDEKNITIIPRGILSSMIIDLSKINQNKPNGQINLLYAGRVVKQKGIDVAINAVNYLINTMGFKNLRLDIIGKGDSKYKEELNNLVNSLQLQNYVSFINQIPREILLEYYSGYDALLFPSVWEEPFGNTIIESMARGLPVIASEVGGVSEIITSGENGILIPPNDFMKIAEAINTLINDHDFRLELKYNAIKTIKEKFTQEIVCNQIENYLFKTNNSYK